jgi:hypothetical protein
LRIIIIYYYAFTCYIIYYQKESDPTGRKLFTGPKAKAIAEEVKQAMESEGSVKQDMESEDSVKQDLESYLHVDRAASDDKMQSLRDKRRIFISCKFPGDLLLEEGTLVLRKVGLSFLPF